MNLDDVRKGFVSAGIPDRLVDELLESYVEAKRRFHLGDLRPNEVEGGRFSEAAFRVLQHVTGQRVTPLGRSLPGTDKLLPIFEGAAAQPDAVRVHIPRTLRLIYDIRNKRDAAHLGDIDPNLQDATHVVGNMDWVMAELVRLYHAVSADDAQRIIEDLVTKEVPAVQEIDGHPVILSRLRARERALLMLYRAGAGGATIDELAAWLREGRKDHLRDRLRRLDDEQLVLEHPLTGRFHITFLGEQYVVDHDLAQPV
jgi:hypothetical protein